MSLFTLVHDEAITVATTRRVFAAEQTGALGTIIEQAESMKLLREQVDERVRASEAQGFERGHAHGLASGEALAAERTAERLLELDQRAEASRERTREGAVSLALDIVRAIARGVGEPAMLEALANQAAHDLLPEETAVLRVHPDRVDALNGKCGTESPGDPDAARQIDLAASIIDVVGDETLETASCVLQTSTGQVVADLETQLRVLQRRMSRHAADER